MHERFVESYETVPRMKWRDEAHRASAEANAGGPVGDYYFAFGEHQYRALLTIDKLGDVVAADMNKQREGNFRSRHYAGFQGPNGTFSHGLLFFCAATTERARELERDFAIGVNYELESLQSPFRLETKI